MRRAPATRLLVFLLVSGSAFHVTAFAADADTYPEGGIFVPRPIYVPPGANASPLYPAEMLADHRIGQAAVICDVHLDGTLADCKITLAKGGRQFANALLQWVRQPGLRFSPIKLAGAPVAGRQIFHINFNLGQ